MYICSQAQQSHGSVAAQISLIFLSKAHYLEIGALLHLF